MPSRLTLHRLVSELRSRVGQLSQASEENAGEQQRLISQLDQLLQVIAQISNFSFPLDLNLARTDMRALLYEVLLRFHDDFAQGGISFEFMMSSDVRYAVVDRLKLREVLGELVRNSLAAMPAAGAQLGIRASLSDDRSQLLIEVVDNGQGTEQPLSYPIFNHSDPSGKSYAGVGLKLTQAIVEQHGGSLTIDSQPGQGTYVQIALPLRDSN